MTPEELSQIIDLLHDLSVRKNITISERRLSFEAIISSSTRTTVLPWDDEVPTEPGDYRWRENELSKRLLVHVQHNSTTDNSRR